MPKNSKAISCKNVWKLYGSNPSKYLASKNFNPTIKDLKESQYIPAVFNASIDVYEWVETTLTPTQWAAQADTEEGLTKGISGTPKDTSTFVQIQKFDSVAKSFFNKYYYYNYI